MEKSPKTVLDLGCSLKNRTLLQGKIYSTNLRPSMHACTYSSVDPDHTTVCSPLAFVSYISVRSIISSAQRKIGTNESPRVSKLNISNTFRVFIYLSFYLIS